MKQGISPIIQENARRHKQLDQPYNPQTGQGCHGQRARINLDDAPFPTLWLPEPMLRNEPIIRTVQKCGSLQKTYEKIVQKEEFEREGKKLDYPQWSSQVNEWFWIQLCELRIRYDFEYFAINYVTIRDKVSGRDIPFRLNRGQRRLFASLEQMRLDGRPIRAMVLKARQWGGSTLVQIYMYWIQIVHRKNWNSIICAHVKDAAITIRAMFERAVDKMMPIDGTKHAIKNYKNTQNIKEVPGRGCTITVGTAIEPDSVRSQDAKMAHFSEQAYYPNTAINNPADLETSIVGSIPAEPYTMVVRESTANGVGDYFHTEWEKAKAGRSAYEAIFVEWFLIDIYSKPFNGFYADPVNGKPIPGTVRDFVGTLTEYELNLFRNHPQCTLENLNWRRIKSSEMSSEAKMKQEYPSDDIEAFQDAGTPVFRSEDVEAMRTNCTPYIAIGQMAGAITPSQARIDPRRKKEVLQNVRFIEKPELLAGINSLDRRERQRKEENHLKIWEYPVADEHVSDRYVVVYDPQKGISDKADWGVITVFDRYWMMHKGKPEVVAEWVGHLDKDIAIWVSAQIAKWYNNALLVIESNTFENEHAKYDESEFIFDTIASVYDNLYARTPADQIKAGAPIVYGWHTNRSTKVLIVNNYIAILREKDYIERSYDTLDEARVYEQKSSGSYGAKNGYHDDRLMTRMIGCQVCYELPLPKIRKQESRAKTSGSSYAVSEAIV